MRTGRHMDRQTTLIYALRDYTNASKSDRRSIRSLFSSRFVFPSLFHLLSLSFSVSVVYKYRYLSPDIEENHNINAAGKSFENVANSNFCKQH